MSTSEYILWTLLVLVGILTVIQFRYIERRVHY